MAEAAPEEADRVGDLPHPRETLRLFGQEAAEEAFLAAWGGGRLHHAWLLAGPRGVGKATLAYRIARARLAAEEGGGLFGAPEPPRTLDLDPEHPVSRRIAAGSEPRLFTLRREADPKTERLYTRIRVEDVRRLKSFFQLSAADGGWRVAVVDPAEEMNANAANALLKVLEEPPPRVLILLVCHAPARLLPTIRSRCLMLKLSPLGAEDLAAALEAAGVETGAEAGALALLSDGSAGEAARLAALGGPALYSRLVSLLAGAPGMNRREMAAIGSACSGRANAETYDLVIRLIDILLARLARAGALGPPSAEAAPGEAKALAALSPGPAAARLWADLALTLGGRAAAARAVNLDPSQVMLDIFLEIDAAARIARAREG
ncbi:MAG: DNA polymerase III subunit delta' [Pikeienuella sp.]|uniref:DNA polymerase III subunit delta' n=1 Tax=Pikeienuella sp. TaxID=2831957 RepID=UPI003919250E